MNMLRARRDCSKIFYRSYTLFGAEPLLYWSLLGSESGGRSDGRRNGYLVGSHLGSTEAKIDPQVPSAPNTVGTYVTTLESGL